MDLLTGADVERTGRNEGVGRSRDAGGRRAPEAIPMSDLALDRSEALRKIHAQSSAETSGLGDSLQRIHTLSSTETSGYGDTVPSPTAPSPSPEAELGRVVCPPERELGRHVSGGALPPASAATGSGMAQRRDGRRTANPEADVRPPRTNPGHSHPPRIPTAADGTPEFVSLAKGKTNVARTRKYARHASPPPPQINTKLPAVRTSTSASAVAAASATDVGRDRLTYGPAQRRYGDDDDDGGVRSSEVPKRTGGRRPKLQRSKDLDEGIDDMTMTYSPTDTPPLARVDAARERERRTTEGKRGQGISGGGTAVGGGGGGPEPQSTWLKWSEDRRTSFKRRLDSLEQRQKDHERTRVTTPVRKARKESVMFVSPQLEDSHMSMGDAYPAPTVPTVAARGSTDKAAAGSGDGAAEATGVANHVVATAHRKPRRQEQEVKTDVRLSEYQMNALAAFWEHDVFVRSRWTGIVLSLVSFILGLIAATNHSWSTFTYPYGYVEVYGLWQNCSSNSSSSDTSHLICSILPWSDWQNAVIGLLIFSVAFGFLATILSICGVCTTQLAKKIYYYHSAGEIYLICALATAAALVVYPVAIEVKDDLSSHSFGVGYGLGWVAAMFFLASALCMCLDDLVRAFARGMCKCCQRDGGGGGDTRV